MAYPDELTGLIARLNTKHGSAQKAVEEARKQAPLLECWEEVMESLALDAVQDLVYRARQGGNAPAKREAMAVPEQKVNVAMSEAVRDASKSFFNTWKIGGTRIGDLTLADLPDLEAAERARADGHTVNADVLKWLGTKLKNGRSVRECVTEEALQREYQRAKKHLTTNSAA